jgi:predicted metal-dependent peptidase
MDERERAESLSKISKQLMLEEPFYGFFLIMLNKQWSARIPTACVGKNGINYQLLINPEFWASLSDEHRKGLIKHELLHIAFNHLSFYFSFRNHELANIAMDMEINQFIDTKNLPEGGITLSSYPELNLDAKAGSRYYYKHLEKAKKDKDEKDTSGSPAMDDLLDSIEKGESPVDHSNWEEFENMSDIEKKLIEHQTQTLLRKIKEQTLKKQGVVPGEIADLIKLEEVLKPKFNWRAYIRRFTGVSTKTFTRKTRRKENKKFPESAGIKIKTRQKMLLAIDTSGSVNNSELTEFMNEIFHLHKAGADIVIIQCDTKINSIAPYKGKFELEVKGRGGTEFDPVLNYYMEHPEFTSLIYFTDGECRTNLKPLKSILWVLSEQSTINNSLPGQVIRLEL